MHETQIDDDDPFRKPGQGYLFDGEQYLRNFDTSHEVRWPLKNLATVFSLRGRANLLSVEVWFRLNIMNPMKDRTGYLFALHVTGQDDICGKWDHARPIGYALGLTGNSSVFVVDDRRIEITEIDEFTPIKYDYDTEAQTRWRWMGANFLRHRKRRQTIVQMLIDDYPMI